MNRRELLKTGIISSFFLFTSRFNVEALQTNEIKILKPKKLLIGDKVGIVAPATFTHRSKKSIKQLKQLKLWVLFQFLVKHSKIKRGGKQNPLV